jgi:hypothetical protein
VNIDTCKQLFDGFSLSELCIPLELQHWLAGVCECKLAMFAVCKTALI